MANIACVVAVDAPSEAEGVYIVEGITIVPPIPPVTAADPEGSLPPVSDAGLQGYIGLGPPCVVH